MDAGKLPASRCRIHRSVDIGVLPVIVIAVGEEPLPRSASAETGSVVLVLVLLPATSTAGNSPARSALPLSTRRSAAPRLNMATVPARHSTRHGHAMLARHSSVPPVSPCLPVSCLAWPWARPSAHDMAHGLNIRVVPPMGHGQSGRAMPPMARHV
jgi:hypothetical protein